MSRLRIFASCFLFLLLGMATGLVAGERDVTAGDLLIEDAWARASLGSVPNSVAYMKIANIGSKTERLLSVSGDVSARVELHETRMTDGVMRMRPVGEGVEIPAEGSVELKQGGLHVMLLGLKRKLVDGDSFTLTLKFERHGEVIVPVSVMKDGHTTADHSHHGMSHKH